MRRFAVDGEIHPGSEASSQDLGSRAPQRFADERVTPKALAQFAVSRQTLQQQFGFSVRQLSVEKRRDLFTDLFAHGSSGLPKPPSKIGRSFLSIASRALKIRERTVPTGQSIVWAISS